MRRRLLVLTILAAALAAAPPPTPARAQSTDQVLTPRTFVEVARRTLPSVVSINTRASQDSGSRVFFFNGRQVPDENARNGAGTGFVIRVDGDAAYVLTNNHVIRAAASADDISITFDGAVGAPDGARQRDEALKVDYGNVKVLGRDELSDLAVLKIDAPKEARLKPLAFADSDAVEVGEWVLALGNPFDLNNSVCQGIVSARGRYLGSGISIQTLIQTTAMIHPGNSGGPLVNLSGQVIGINNAIATRTGAGQGISFAIPSNEARRISEELISDGAVSRGYLGINMGPLALAPELAEKLKLDDVNGVVVGDVVPDTPAMEAGLKTNDVIRGVDKLTVKDSEELLRLIASRRKDDKITLDVLRLDGDEIKRLTISTRLTERPPREELERQRQAMNPTPSPSPGRGLFPNFPRLLPQGPGMTQPDPNEKLRLPEINSSMEAIGIEVAPSEGKPGLRITKVEPDSPAAKAGLREGDVLLRWNGQRLRVTEDMGEALGLTTNGEHTVTYERGGSSMFATITTE